MQAYLPLGGRLNQPCTVGRVGTSKHTEHFHQVSLEALTNARGHGSKNAGRAAIEVLGKLKACGRGGADIVVDTIELVPSEGNEVFDVAALLGIPNGEWHADDGVE